MLPIVAESILLETLAQNYGLDKIVRVTTATSETQNYPSPKNLKTRQQRRLAVDDENLR
jgi:hypothetical protein